MDCSSSAQNLGPIRAEAVRTMARRFAELAASAPDPGQEVKATPGWSIDDVLGHVAMEPSRYEELARGQGTWPAQAVGLPAFNAEQIRTLPTREPEELAAKLLADTEKLLGTVEAFGDRPPMMNFDGNQRVRADRAVGTLLGEFVVHGYDIARATQSDWPIDRAYVPIILDGLHQVMPGWVNTERARTHVATYELRLRGLGVRHVYSLARGKLVVDPPASPAIDLHIDADPVTWLLLSYGRASQLRASCTGRILVWGRRPWLAARFSGLFHSA